MSCGHKLPVDIHERQFSNKKKQKWWILPLAALLFSIIIISSTQYYYNQKSKEALSLYHEAKEMALVGDYEQAKQLINAALRHKTNFPEAATASEFLDKTFHINEALGEVEKFNEEQAFTKSFDKINQVEDEIQNYNGPLIEQLQDQVTALKNETSIQQISYQLNNNPKPDELKGLIWEIEDISHERANEISNQIRDKLVSYVYQEAKQLLDDHQFSSAQTVVEDGLSYVEDSEPLQNLKTTIQKEKVAFETAQEKRIEQALSTAEKEREVNQSDAIELKDTNIEKNNDQIIVSGKLKSVATVPVHSVLISYTIITDEEEAILSNEVYAIPETLYPEESGDFEFTHFDIEEDYDRLTIKVDEVTWYLDE
ncbi:hypothetical protein [Gracilibacillus sp. YIM 98692]|uniref:hypothetical protein n=1 Tax=Gracilibacillus sp. YIM 98692 TaxID=2663532 RepID=UPI001F09D5AB|nr:hypothetical protein [Gracilibacillus sp. YIM 98692]